MNTIYNARTLAHHGIQGMHWGEMHGPPYPLNPKVSSRIQKSAKAGSSSSSSGRTVGVQGDKFSKRKAKKSLDELQTQKAKQLREADKLSKKQKSLDNKISKNTAKGKDVSKQKEAKREIDRLVKENKSKIDKIEKNVNKKVKEILDAGYTVREIKDGRKADTARGAKFARNILGTVGGLASVPVNGALTIAGVAGGIGLTVAGIPVAWPAVVALSLGAGALNTATAIAVGRGVGNLASGNKKYKVDSYKISKAKPQE